MRYTEEELAKILAGMEPAEREETLRLNEDPELGKRKVDTSLEDELARQISATGLPEPVRDKVRVRADRRWRIDFAWTERRIAVEVEGGTRMKTSGGYSAGHAHPDRFESDCRKYNEMTLAGWRLFRFTGDMIRSGEAREVLLRAFVLLGGKA